LGGQEKGVSPKKWGKGKKRKRKKRLPVRKKREKKYRYATNFWKKKKNKTVITQVGEKTHKREGTGHSHDRRKSYTGEKKHELLKKKGKKRGKSTKREKKPTRLGE